MDLKTGSHLGSYEITGQLGAGGMGEVYRAHDSKLERDVAIKVLPPDFADSQERLARFEREAKALAALNHPNIATVHGFEQDGSTHFLVMELVEGEDLAERLRRGPMPVGEVLPLFVQIAEGLEAAHEKGIVHRDLKPANLRTSMEQADRVTVKIIDFGLARALEATSSGSVDLSASPTMTAGATRLGEILGTAAYMSPEQARGIPADHRADVWAFGCCLYETLTGQRPFHGDDAAQVLAAVLKDTPDWSALPTAVPDHVAVLLRRCLTKSRRRRLQSIGDARVELEEALATPDHLPPHVENRNSAQTPGGRNPWRWLLAAAATLLVGGGVGGYLIGTSSKDGSTATAPTVVHIPVSPPEGVEIPYTWYDVLALSPDGRFIAYVGEDEDGERLYLQDLEAPGVAAPVKDSEAAYAPFFSPDSESMGFLQAGMVVRPLSGGDAVHVTDGIDRTSGEASWAGDGIYFSGAAPEIHRVAPSENGRREAVTAKRADGYTEQDPQLLPGSDLLLFRRYEDYGRTSPIVVASRETGVETVVFERACCAHYVEATGHLLAQQADVLVGMTLDLETLQVGEAVAVIEGMMTDVGEAVAGYAVSETGSLVYLTGSPEDESFLVRLTPAADSTSPSSVTRLHERPFDFDYLQIDVSPDGSRVAVTKNDGDVWVFDLARGDFSVRLTSAPQGDWMPVWTPDGENLIFNSSRDSSFSFYSRRADGVGEVKALLDAPSASRWARSVSPDGAILLFEQMDAQTLNDVWQVPIGQPDAAEPFLRSPYEEAVPRFSPDGKWVAYQSNESGSNAIYVTSYPGGQIKEKISRDGATEPRWSERSDRLFYRVADRVMVVDALDDKWKADDPELFVRGVDGAMTWDIAPDGQSVIALEKRRAQQLHLVQNWFEELKRLVPVE